MPIEHVTIDQRRSASMPKKIPINHPDGWAPGGIDAVARRSHRVSRPGRRRSIMLREAQMTTVDGESHLFSFGEFAAMYVMVWCNACWPLPDELADRARRACIPAGDAACRPVAPDGRSRRVDWDKLKAEDVGRGRGQGTTMPSALEAGRARTSQQAALAPRGAGRRLLEGAMRSGAISLPRSSPACRRCAARSPTCRRT